MNNVIPAGRGLAALLVLLSPPSPLIALAGPAVGHPTGLIDVSDPGDLTLQAMPTTLTEVQLDRCDGTVDVESISLTTDLARQPTVTLTEGWVCGVVLVLGGPLNIEGTEPSGAEITRSLSVQELHLEGPEDWLEDGDQLLLRVGEAGWYSPTLTDAELADKLRSGTYAW